MPNPQYEYEGSAHENYKNNESVAGAIPGYLVGNPIQIKSRPIPVGAEIEYAHFGSVTIEKDNGDDTYDLSIPGVESLRRIPVSALQYMQVAFEIKVFNVRYRRLVADPGTNDRFRQSICEALVTELEGKITREDVLLVELLQSSHRQNEEWRPATVVRVLIFPPFGHTASSIEQVLSAPACRFCEKVSDTLVMRMRDLPVSKRGVVSAELRYAKVQGNKASFPDADLQAQHPEFCLYYYNEDDPRRCICGRDTTQCHQLSPAANLSNPSGILIFALMLPFVWVVLPLRIIC